MNALIMHRLIVLFFMTDKSETCKKYSDFSRK